VTARRVSPPACGTLEGRIVDPLGGPVEGAVVRLYPKFKWNQYFLARTNHDGFYRWKRFGATAGS